MACATFNGMAGMVAVEFVGSVERPRISPSSGAPVELTTAVMLNGTGRLHQRCNPPSDNRFGGRIEQVCPAVRMFHFENVAPRLDVIVESDLVTRNIDTSLDLGFLKSRLASAPEKSRGCQNRVVAASHPVQIMPFQHAIPLFPSIIIFSLLHQPAVEIGGSNLPEDAGTLHET